MLDQSAVLKDVTAILVRNKIPFMITGSMAMNYYAQPRMTRDIDIIIAITKNDIKNIVSLFQGGYYISEDAVSESIENMSLFNIIHNESVVKVDFIILKTDVFHQNEFSRRKRVKINDFETYLVSKEDLILAKLLRAKKSDSEMQLNDVRNLMKSGYDEKYVTNWLRKLNIEDMYRKLLYE